MPPQPVPPHLDPDSVAIIAALQRQIDAQQKQLAAQRSELNYAQLKIQVLEERLRKQRIEKYGKASEKLSDLQLESLDHEPAVSNEEIESEAAGGPLPAADEEQSAERGPRRKNRQHPGRNELPAHLRRVEEIVACAADGCRCGRCGGETRVIGYEESEVLGMKPAEYFVRIIKREKRACPACVAQGVATAPAPERIAPKSIFADDTIVEFIVRKYCDSVPLYRQRAILMRDLGIDVALTTINDAVLRVGELLIPIVDAMKRDLLAGSYIQADETHVAVQTPEKKGENHRAFFWQYSAPAKGVVFDFEMTRSKKVAEEFFKDYGGILHTDGYVAYEKDIGTKDLIHACCLAHARRGFVDAIKVQAKGQAVDARLERIVALMDDLFAIDRQAREQNLSLADRHALRQERAPALLDELHALLVAMEASCAVLPQSIAGKALNYTLKRWVELTRFLEHPVIELSTNWAENSMRPIAIGRRNWLHLGSKEAGPKIAAIFSIVESCRKLGVPIRQYLTYVLPGLADRSIQELSSLAPASYAANLEK
ncbi:MAG: IS66 family transposase [Terracidiphilus sp.]|jgi:transposase